MPMRTFIAMPAVARGARFGLALTNSAPAAKVTSSAASTSRHDGRRSASHTIASVIAVAPSAAREPVSQSAAPSMTAPAIATARVDRDTFGPIATTSQPAAPSANREPTAFMSGKCGLMRVVKACRQKAPTGSALRLAISISRSSEKHASSVRPPSAAHASIGPERGARCTTRSITTASSRASIQTAASCQAGNSRASEK